MPDPIPVVVLGRLAVATSHHGRSMGRELFQDAVLCVVTAADVFGITLDAPACALAPGVSLLPGLGLESSPLDPMTLVATVEDLRAVA
jgi:hypothetical protein